MLMAETNLLWRVAKVFFSLSFLSTMMIFVCVFRDFIPMLTVAGIFGFYCFQDWTKGFLQNAPQNARSKV
jgi:hypothetical protein